MKHFLVILLLLVVGCTTDGPRFTPDELETLVLQGSMPDESVTFDRQVFTVSQSGTVNFRMTTLEARNAVTGELFENPALIVNFGTAGLNVENEEICQVSVSNFLGEGDSFSLGLRNSFAADGDPRVYCLVLLRPDEVVLPGTAVITYTMTLTGAFS